MAVILKVKKLVDNAVIPEAKTKDSVGLDLYVAEDMILYPAKVCDKAYKVSTGIALEIPKGYHAKIFLRSSTGLKTPLRLANGTGIIDADYRGEVMLLVENISSDFAYISKGERLAQLILEKNTDFKIQEVKELSDTERGTGGMGSTGK